MTKRSKQYVEIDAIGNISDEASNVCICGMIKSLSPLRKSRSNTDYCDGELIDTTGKIRLFGFHAPIHQKLQEHSKAKKPIVSYRM